MYSFDCFQVPFLLFNFNEWRFIGCSAFHSRNYQMAFLLPETPHRSSFHKVPFWREEENICQWTTFYTFVPCCFLISLFLALRLLSSPFFQTHYFLFWILGIFSVEETYIGTILSTCEIFITQIIGYAFEIGL